MAFFKANPVIVEAWQIVSVGPETGRFKLRHLALSNGENVQASCEMLARMTPEPGDYWVRQQDGYVYLNPKAVFERKYTPVADLEMEA